MHFNTVSQRILLTFWVGGLWAVGYVVVPVLFNMIFDRFVAGGIAGRLFSIMSYIGLVCGTLLLTSVIYQAGREWRRIWQVWVLLAMLLIVAIGEFMLQPMMQALKAATPQGFVPGSAQAARFGMLHGVSSLLYLATSLLGLVLVVFGLERRAAE
jgi:MFS family permease